MNDLGAAIDMELRSIPRETLTFNPALSWWLPMIVCHALLITYVYNRNHRSLLAVLVFHAMMNFTGEWLRISPDMYPFMLTGTLLITAVVVWRMRAETV